MSPASIKRTLNVAMDIIDLGAYGGLICTQAATELGSGHVYPLAQM